MLKNHAYEFQCRGKIKVKGKGEMTTYFLTNRRAPSTIRMDDLLPVLGQGIPHAVSRAGIQGHHHQIVNNSYPCKIFELVKHKRALSPNFASLTRQQQQPQHSSSGSRWQFLSLSTTVIPFVSRKSKPRSDCSACPV